MTDALPMTLHALATEAADGSGASADIGAQRSCLKLELLVESMAATKLAVTLQHAARSTGPWEQLGAMPAVTAAVTREALFLDAKRWVRAVWDVTGGDAKFELSGAAHTLFADPSDVAAYAFPEKVFEKLAIEDVAAACLAATDEAASYLNSGFGALETWGEALTIHVSKMAGYYVMAHRGFQPQGSDELLVKGYDDAIKWLSMVAKGTLRPPGMTDATPTKFKNSARVVSREPGRGW